MPTNDPNQPQDGRQEQQQIIARTLLRTFLATPPLSPQEAGRRLKRMQFQSHHGELGGYYSKFQWIAASRVLRNNAVTVVMPEMSETLANYRTMFSGTQVASAMQAMLQNMLAVDYNECQAGHIKPYGG